MGPKSFAYRLSVLFTGLNLLAVVVAIAGTSRVFGLIGDLTDARRAEFGAVTILEFFLLGAISATSTAITLYVKRGQ